MNAEHVWEYVIGLLLAFAGCFARLLHVKDKEKLKKTIVAAELFIAGFAGVMVLMLAQNLGVSNNWVGVVCGVAGLVGPRIIDLIAKPVGKMLGIDVGEANNEKEGDEHHERDE